MTVKQSMLRRFVAGAGVFTLVTAGLMTASTPALADVGPGQPDAPTNGSLTINKYSGGVVDSVDDLDPALLLDGVEFTVTQVGIADGATCAPIDLTQAAAWDGLAGLFDSAPAAPAAPFCLSGTPVVQSTAGGTTVFNLGVGVYFVQETDPGNNNIVSPVPNFYVSIPTSLGDAGDGWNYNVVADPKNQLMDAPSKTIAENQEELVVGSDVTWTISAPIPTLNNDEKFTEASVTDVLDSRLTYVSGSSKLTAGTTPLVEGTHYTVSGNAVWTLTSDGLAVLDANMGENLTVEFDTKVVSVGDGSIPNDVYESTFNGTTVPGANEPYTYWGQLSILKVDDSTPAALPLAGAQFQVFEAIGSPAECADDAPTSGALATGTSDENGVVQWAGVTPTGVLGLWIANSNEPLSDPSKAYCVYETVVPAGHTATPIANPVLITPGETNVNKLTVTNAKTQGPDLPLTGAQGTLLMSIGGLLLVVVGGGILIARRMRNSNQPA